MAAAVDKGLLAEAEPNDGNIIRIQSDGFEPFEVSLDHLWPEEREAGTSVALVRGMAGILAEKGRPLRGFDAQITSSLPSGAGLSSSAAFTVLAGYMIAHFASLTLSAEELAKAAQKAENRWFGKPCGLMDPMICALGGGVYMDVLESRILPVDCDFDKLGLALCLTYTGGSHAHATAAYAAIPADMSAVANVFGEKHLAKVRPMDFELHWPEHENELPWMRARHFFDETHRVSRMADALGLHDGHQFMKLMNQSGRSSETLLQNITAPDCGTFLAEGLELSAQLLEGKGAWRVHGGGFAGCVQALMPEEEFPAYQDAMEALFGPGSCQRVHIYSRGVGQIED